MSADDTFDIQTSSGDGSSVSCPTTEGSSRRSNHRMVLVLERTNVSTDHHKLFCRCWVPTEPDVTLRNTEPICPESLNEYRTKIGELEQFTQKEQVANERIQTRFSFDRHYSLVRGGICTLPDQVLKDFQPFVYANNPLTFVGSIESSCELERDEGAPLINRGEIGRHLGDFLALAGWLGLPVPEMFVFMRRIGITEISSTGFTGEVSISAFTRQDGSTAPMTLAEKCHVQQLVLRETPARKMKRADGTICYDLDFQGCPMFEIHFNGDATKVDVDQLGELLQNAIAKVPRVADLKLYVRIIEAPIYEGFARKTVLMQETDIRTQKITLNFLRTFKDLLPKVPQEMIDGLGQINTLLKPGYVPGGVPEDYLSFPF